MIVMSADVTDPPRIIKGGKEDLLRGINRFGGEDVAGFGLTSVLFLRGVLS